MKKFKEVTIDRIHHLAEQSGYLRSIGKEQEADILLEEAEEHAAELRKFTSRV